MKISKKKIMCLLCAVLAVVTLSAPMGQALSSWTKSIDVYTGVNIYIDDQKLDPTDVNGNPVEPFIYNGTTYLPVRALSQALGKLVQWDGETSSVYVGKHESDKPAVWLYDIEPTKGRIQKVGPTRDTLGYTRTHVLNAPSAWDASEVEYDLNGAYTKLTGVFFQPEEHKDNSEHTELEIYGDDVLLYTAKMWGSSKYVQGVDPISFEVDLTGVQCLTIRTNKHTYVAAGYGRAMLGDCGLWS